MMKIQSFFPPTRQPALQHSSPISRQPQTTTPLPALYPVLTYFELVTVMAAKIFAHYSVDCALYEIGLGGRLDAVNALSPPDLCVLATLGFDHMQYLGDTIEQITAEKAEIIPKGGRVVFGPQEYEASEPVVERYVAERQAEMIRPERGVAEKLLLLHDGEEQIAGRAAAAVKAPPGGNIAFFDAHILQHLDTAIAAARTFFPEVNIEDGDIVTGVSGLSWPGRMQDAWIRDKHFLLDAAHNTDGVRCLGKALEKRKLKIERVLFGTMRDKVGSCGTGWTMWDGWRGRLGEVCRTAERHAPLPGRRDGTFAFAPPREGGPLFSRFFSEERGRSAAGVALLLILCDFFRSSRTTPA